MRGHTRVRKKHLRQAGFELLEEGRANEGTYYVRLRTPRGEDVRLEAATRTRAFRSAEASLVPKEPRVARE